MFDQSKQFEVKIYSGGVVKSCPVRWPADQEWTANAVKRLLITESKGDGTAIRADHLKADGELYRRIRVIQDKEGNPITPVDLDDAEAAEVIRKLEYCAADADSASLLTGSTATLSFRVCKPNPGFPVSHTLKIPGQAQFREYQRDKDTERIKARRVESHSNLPLSERIYNELALSSDGYSGSVPIIHKDFAVRLVMDRFAEEVAKLDEPPEE